MVKTWEVGFPESVYIGSLGPLKSGGAIKRKAGKERDPRQSFPFPLYFQDILFDLVLVYWKIGSFGESEMDKIRRILRS